MDHIGIAFFASQLLSFSASQLLASMYFQQATPLGDALASPRGGDRPPSCPATPSKGCCSGTTWAHAKHMVYRVMVWNQIQAARLKMIFFESRVIEAGVIWSSKETKVSSVPCVVVFVNGFTSGPRQSSPCYRHQMDLLPDQCDSSVGLGWQSISLSCINPDHLTFTAALWVSCMLI